MPLWACRGGRGPPAVLRRCGKLGNGYPGQAALGVAGQCVSQKPEEGEPELPGWSELPGADGSRGALGWAQGHTASWCRQSRTGSLFCPVALSHKLIHPVSAS